MLNGRVAQKIRNSQGARVTALPAQMYYTFLRGKIINKYKKMEMKIF